MRRVLPPIVGVATFACLTLALGACATATDDRSAPMPRRPVSTYSIVARDAQTGQLGVAVQSHWYSVGTVVPWAEPGVGAVATQSLVDVRYGPSGLALMRNGRDAQQALSALTSTDPGKDVRQVAMIDAHGTVATHTGSRCIAEASHVAGTAPDGSVYSCQANMMGPPGVPNAMAKAFEHASGDLIDRLLDALDAAQAVGGDIRGKQSAAILVVRGESTDEPWTDTLIDLNIADHPDPLVELRRLVTLHRAYDLMNAGDAALEVNDVDAALKAYSGALKLAPDSAEMAFWTGVSLAGVGRVDDAEPYLARAYADEADWRGLLRRLPASGLFPDDPQLIGRLCAIEARP